MIPQWERLSLVLLLCLVPLLGYAVTPMVAAGSRHTIALNSDGTVVTVGSDANGQLGLGRLTSSAKPLPVQGLGTVREVAAGYASSLALMADGTVWRWGTVFYGDTTSVPAPVLGLAEVRVIRASINHAVALRDDGTVWTWGGPGIMGSGLCDGTTSYRPTPVQVPGVNDAKDVAAGPDYTLILRQDGTVWSCGDNRYGQLGDGTTTRRSAPVQVKGLTEIGAVAATSFTSMALKNDGTVWIWGATIGKCPPGASCTPPVFGPPIWMPGILNTPGQVPGLVDIGAMAPGYGFAFALGKDGSLYAWGNNGAAELGDGTRADRDVPVRIGGITGVKAVGTSIYGGIALKQDGTVWAWGVHNISLGLSGDVGVPDTLGPVRNPGLSGITGIAVASQSALALRQDGTVLAWGGNDRGQLADGSLTARSMPISVPNLTEITKIAAGPLSRSSFAIRRDGTVWAWGRIGASDRSDPALISGLAGVVDITCSSNGTFAVLRDGTVWNLNYTTQVSGIKGVTAVSTGFDHTLAQGQDGTIWAWGANAYGQLGDGTSTDRNAPGPVSGLTDIRAVSAGFYHSMALKGDGTVWTWGSNANGKLGDGTTVDRSSPVQVNGLTGITAIAASNGYSVALKSDGTVWFWGVTGDGTTVSASSTPVLVQGLTGVNAISAGETHLVALRSDGTVWGLGINSQGQLGDGTFVNRLSVGLMINEAVTGALDLDSTVPNSIPASAVPKIILGARKIGGVSSLILGASIYFGTIDLGTIASGNFAASGMYKVYVAAIVPGVGVYMLDTNRNWAYYAGGPLREYERNVTLDQTLHYFVSIFDRMDLTRYIGTRIIVGFGTDDQEMLAAQRYREIFVAEAESAQ